MVGGFRTDDSNTIEEIRNELRSLIVDNNCATLMLRLIFHDANSGNLTGEVMEPRNGVSSNDQTADGHDTALKFATDLLESVKANFPMISHADLYQLAGAVALDYSEDQAVAAAARCKPRGVAHRVKNITEEELSRNFHLPINEVALKLGLCVTVLKQRCREHGIRRWPFRKVRKLDALIDTLEKQTSSETSSEPIVCHVDDERRRKLETAKEMRSFLLMNPNSAAHLKLGKVKSDSLKRSGRVQLRRCQLKGAKTMPAVGSPSACGSDCTTENLNLGEVCSDLSAETPQYGASAEALDPRPREEVLDGMDLNRFSNPQPIVERNLLSTWGLEESHDGHERRVEKESLAQFLHIDLRPFSEASPKSMSTVAKLHGFSSCHELPRMFEPLLPSAGTLAHSERSAFQPLVRQSSVASSSFDGHLHSSLKPQAIQAAFLTSKEGHGCPVLTRPVARAPQIGDLANVPVLGFTSNAEIRASVGSGLTNPLLDSEPPSFPVSNSESTNSFSSRSNFSAQLFGQPLQRRMEG